MPAISLLFLGVQFLISIAVYYLAKKIWFTFTLTRRGLSFPTWICSHTCTWYCNRVICRSIAHYPHLSSEIAF